MADDVECFGACRAADFAFGFGERGNDEAARCRELCRFGDLLDKREEVFERAAGELSVGEGSSVGDEFVDEDDARPDFVEEDAECIAARCDALGIGLGK